jgi:hypothetical protein
MLLPLKLISFAFLAACCIFLGTETALAQGQRIPRQSQKNEAESPELKRLKTVERHFGTIGAGVFVILLGLAGIGKAAWMIRPVFRGDSIWYKVGVVLLIFAGIFVILIGVDLARQGSQGKTLDQWANEL